MTPTHTRRGRGARLERRAAAASANSSIFCSFCRRRFTVITAPLKQGRRRGRLRQPRYDDPSARGTVLPELLQVNCDVVLALFRDVKKLHTAQMTAESLIDRCAERDLLPLPPSSSSSRTGGMIELVLTEEALIEAVVRLMERGELYITTSDQGGRGSDGDDHDDEDDDGVVMLSEAAAAASSPVRLTATGAGEPSTPMDKVASPRQQAPEVIQQTRKERQTKKTSKTKKRERHNMKERMARRAPAIRIGAVRKATLRYVVFQTSFPNIDACPHFVGERATHHQTNEQ